MIWFLIILIIVFLAVYVYFSIIIAAGIVDKIKSIDQKISDLYENDEWCEKEIKEISKTTDELYSTHMKDISAAWLKIDNISNDINRTKMRVGKIEQERGYSDEVDRN